MSGLTSPPSTPKRENASAPSPQKPSPLQPYKGGKKGADQGIDGVAFIEVSRGKTEKVPVSVKGGENVGAAMTPDLSMGRKNFKAAQTEENNGAQEELSF
ncbi:MAG: hypothetical protein LBG69_00595 [Zoogloeaceae bacterium]|jgi:hypothetical protein|nr:hypothetical protein [Zoogloeaceae bacterium]